ncbi:hypothetical protein [Ramlibacter rhizophilus]|uniref:Uncharacterized protein n=1 Tax=Ramlibacter rhizophilus TaxID=1781167 RepID=A0A4Z0BS49_9BURK|nr:hypothetical protein [Ramlibacter rhizophilus]TFZ01661.1 hypothetical protein EZ242_09845 [Ramlibacter rhizophilus]
MQVAAHSRFVTLTVPDQRLWVRVLAFLFRAPVPKVKRDFIATTDAHGEWQLQECSLGEY